MHGVDRAAVVDLYVGGLSLLATAARYGCCVNTVTRALAKVGVAPRPRKGGVRGGTGSLVDPGPLSARSGL